MNKSENIRTRLEQKKPKILSKISNSIMEIFLDKLLKGINVGYLQVNFPSGKSLFYGNKNQNPKANVTIHNFRMIRKLLIEGDVGFAESYIEGAWDTTELFQVLELGPKHALSIERKILGFFPFRFMNLFKHFKHDNSLKGSKKNIAEHYDLGNEFYKHWLDSSMTYSSAIFDKNIHDLDTAQISKYRKIIEKLNINKEKTILEIA